MELRKKLAELRRKKGLTQSELARKLGVTRQAVSGWERGAVAPTTEKLVALGRLYGVPLDELADDSLPLTGQPAVAVEEEPPVAEEEEATPPEAVEEPEATPPADGEAPGKRGRNIAARIGLAACLVLVTIAAIITIVSAIKKEPERPEDGLTIVDQDDLVGEDIDLSQVIDGTDGTEVIESADGTTTIFFDITLEP